MGRRRVCEADRNFRGEIARKFREAMKERDLNQAAAAKELGVTRQAFSQYVLEKTTPQGEILARACAKWSIKLRYRDVDFSRGAFGAIEAKPLESDAIQMGLFKDAQVFENRHLIVKIERSQKATLQVTIKMKKAGLSRRSGNSSKTVAV